MTVKNVKTTKDIIIKTDDDSTYEIEICTFLGTTIFRDSIRPLKKHIKIKGLNCGKYIIYIANNTNLFKQQIVIS